MEEELHQVREAISQAEVIDDPYHETGFFATVVRSLWFEQACLAVILCNAVWLMIDVDFNKEALLINAHPAFQATEHAFCLLFVLEWVCRFMAYRHKLDSLHDSWFMLDSLLVGLMVFETWVMTLVTWLASVSSSGGFGTLSILRLLRLLRLTRMAKLMRAIPELFILIKALVTSARSVMLTLLLLMIIVYMFAIIFVQIMPEDEEYTEKFGTVPKAMYTLLLDGIIPDQGGFAYTMSKDRHWYLAAVFLFFVAISTLTLINMLIGIICEVVANAAAAEKERTDIEFVKNRLKKVLDTFIDVNDDGLISKAEFLGILKVPQAVMALRQVGVNAKHLLDHADYVFEDDFTQNDDGTETACQRKLTFEEFMYVVLQLRQNNSATVRDVAELRKFVHTRMLAIEGRLELRGRFSAEVCSPRGRPDPWDSPRSRGRADKGPEGSPRPQSRNGEANIPKGRLDFLETPKSNGRAEKGPDGSPTLQECIDEAEPQALPPMAMPSALPLPQRAVEEEQPPEIKQERVAIAPSAEVGSTAVRSELCSLKRRMDRIEQLLADVASTQSDILSRLMTSSPPDCAPKHYRESCTGSKTDTSTRTDVVQSSSLPSKAQASECGPWDPIINCAKIGRKPRPVSAIQFGSASNERPTAT